ncbi:MAG TPA: aldo/keto reductase, partial [Dehalococcoidales bacterium]|nr:aldo/keto reductase [Dehalococcoidales bacterium]
IVEDIANNKSCKPSQIALAWVLAQGNDIIPLFGTKHIEYLEENIKALTIELTNEEKSELDKIAARIVGERFAPPAMGRVRGGQDWD